MSPFLPMSPVLLDTSLKEFSHVAGIISGLVGLIMVARFVLLLIQVSGSEEYAAVLRDALIFFISISLFPPLMRALVSTTSHLAFAIQFDSVEVKSGTLASYFKAIEDRIPLVGLVSDLGHSSVLHMARGAYSLLLSILIAIGPVVIFTARLIFANTLQPYVTSILILSLWPVTWNLLGSLALKISKGFESTSIGQFCFWLIVDILQLLSPIFSAYLFKNLASGEAIQRPLAFMKSVKSISPSTGGRK